MEAEHGPYVLRVKYATDSKENDNRKYSFRSNKIKSVTLFFSLFSQYLVVLHIREFLLKNFLFYRILDETGRKKMHCFNDKRYAFLLSIFFSVYKWKGCFVYRYKIYFSSKLFGSDYLSDRRFSIFL